MIHMEWFAPKRFWSNYSFFLYFSKIGTRYTCRYNFLLSDIGFFKTKIQLPVSSWGGNVPICPHIFLIALYSWGRGGGTKIKKKKKLTVYTNQFRYVSCTGS